MTLDSLEPELFSTDFEVLEDPGRKEFVLVLKGQELGRVSYDEVFTAAKSGSERAVTLLKHRVPPQE